MEKSKDFAILLTAITLILGISISPYFVESADALKGQGVPTNKFGSTTKGTVCGDKLCSEVKSLEIEEQKKKELQEKIQEKLAGMKEPVKSQSETRNETMEIPEAVGDAKNFVTQTGKFPTSKLIGVIPIGEKNSYTVIFQVCASKEVDMRAPEVVISSDSAIKNVRINKVIPKETCTRTVSSINSESAENISVKVIDKSKLNLAIEKAEKELEKIENEIASINNNLQTKLKSSSGELNLKSINGNEINELTSKLSELRKQRDLLKLEYYELIYVLKPN